MLIPVDEKTNLRRSVGDFLCKFVYIGGLKLGQGLAIGLIILVAIIILAMVMFFLIWLDNETEEHEGCRGAIWGCLFPIVVVVVVIISIVIAIAI